MRIFPVRLILLEVLISAKNADRNAHRHSSSVDFDQTDDPIAKLFGDENGDGLLHIVMHEERRLIGFVVVDDDGGSVGGEGMAYFSAESAVSTFDDGDPRAGRDRLTDRLASVPDISRGQGEVGRSDYLRREM